MYNREVSNLLEDTQLETMQCDKCFEKTACSLYILESFKHYEGQVIIFFFPLCSLVEKATHCCVASVSFIHIVTPNCHS